MADPYAKLSADDPITFPHELWNAWTDAALDLKQRREGTAADDKGFVRSSGIIRVKNTTGATRNQFEIVGLGDPVVLPSANENEFRQEVMLQAIEPDGDEPGKFAILLEPIPNNEFGKATASGVAICKLEIIAESDQFAEVDDAVYTKLKTGESGSARIVWKESGTGTKWGVVRIGAGGGAASTKVVRITSLVTNADGYYPGKTQIYDVDTNSWADGEDIWILDGTA